MVADLSTLSVCNRATCEETSTDSVTAPTSRTRFPTSSLSLASSGIAIFENFLKPGDSTETEYVPGNSPAARKLPSAPVVVTTVKFREGSVMVTVARWMGADCGSSTCPLIEPVMVCPYVESAHTPSIEIAIGNQLRIILNTFP